MTRSRHDPTRVDPHVTWCRKFDYVRWQMVIPRGLSQAMKAKAKADGVALHKLNARYLAEGLEREAGKPVETAESVEALLGEG